MYLQRASPILPNHYALGFGHFAMVDASLSLPFLLHNNFTVRTRFYKQPVSVIRLHYFYCTTSIALFLH